MAKPTTHPGKGPPPGKGYKSPDHPGKGKGVTKKK